MLQSSIYFIFLNFILFLSLIFGILNIIFNKTLTKRKILMLFAISCLLFAAYSGFLAFSQYKLWQKSAIMKYVLPPYKNMDYFMLYSYHIFFKRIIWRIISAVIIFAFIFILDKMFRGTLFYTEEFLLLPYLAFLIDFPLGFLILPIGLFALLINHIVQSKNEMFLIKRSFKIYWSYIALLLIIVNIMSVYFGLLYKIQP